MGSGTQDDVSMISSATEAVPMGLWHPSRSRPLGR
nr:MAG TPA_asm: hypothetical protein [Bacteriophage sp.]